MGYKTPYTVRCGYNVHYRATLVVDAATVEDALDKALEASNEIVEWTPTDGTPYTFIDAVARGEVADPFQDGETIPDRFRDPAFRSVNWSRIEAVETDCEVLLFSLEKGPFCGFVEQLESGELFITVSYTGEPVDAATVTHWAGLTVPDGVRIGVTGYAMYEIVA